MKAQLNARADSRQAPPQRAAAVVSLHGGYSITNAIGSAEQLHRSPRAAAQRQLHSAIFGAQRIDSAAQDVIQCTHRVTGEAVDMLDGKKGVKCQLPAGMALWVLGVTKDGYAKVAYYREQNEDDDGQSESDQEESSQEDNEVDWEDIAADDEDEALGYVALASLTLQPVPQPPGDDVPDHWSRANGPPFGKRGPRMKDIRQGQLNDCFFLAPLAAVACTPKGKVLIADILKDKGNGKFSASFCNLDDDNSIGEREEVEVDRWLPTTKEHKPLYNQPQHSVEEEVPIWASLLEKAYAQWDPDGYAGLDMQDASRAIAHLTGIEPESLPWDTASKDVLGETDPGWVKDTFKQEELEDEEIARAKKKKKKGGSDDEDAELAKPRPVKDISAERLYALLRAARLDDNAVLVAESRSAKNSHTQFLDKEKQVRDSHVYVIHEVRKDKTLMLWDPVTSEAQPLGIDKFRQYFVRVLRATL